MRSRRVLLTGFEPFAGDGHNPSWPAARDAAARLNEQWGTEGRGEGGEDRLEAVAVELPCAFAAATESLEQALAEHRPHAVIACGLAGGRSAVALERVAVNLQDARIPDNAGDQPAGTPVEEGGPAAYFTSLPVKRIAAALRSAGIATELSLSAGSFVCNHVFYALMHRADVAGVHAAGFVHVPWDAEHAPEGVPALPAAALTDALVRTVQEVTRPASDPDRPDTVGDLTVPEGTLH